MTRRQHPSRVDCRHGKPLRHPNRRVRRGYESLETRFLLSVTATGPAEDRAAWASPPPVSSLETLRAALVEAGQLEQYADSQLAQTEQWLIMTRAGADLQELAERLQVSFEPVRGLPQLAVTTGPPTGIGPHGTTGAAKRIEFAAWQQQLLSLGDILAAQPLVPHRVATRMLAPNDPRFTSQWYLHNTESDAGPAPIDLRVLPVWDLVADGYHGLTGTTDDGRSVVVAVVDSGVDLSHVDLISNRWNNPGEVRGDANSDGAPGVSGVDDDHDGLIDENRAGCGVVPGSAPVTYRTHAGDACTYVADNVGDDDENGYVDDYHGWDWLGNDNLPRPSASDSDGGHGTSVAGVIAAAGNNGVGVSGVAPRAKWVPLRLISSTGLVTDTMKYEALTYDNQQIQIYNNSWGPGSPREYAPLTPLHEFALEQGIREGRGGLGTIFVVAAGNDGQVAAVSGIPALADSYGDRSDYDQFASSRFTINVGQTNQRGDAPLTAGSPLEDRFSEPGASVLVAAGGVGIMTTDITGPDGYSADASALDYHGNFTGTSAAAPMVSGVVALMLEANPLLTWRDVQHILVATARPFNHLAGQSLHSEWRQNLADKLVSDRYGYGFVDAERAVRMARSWTTVAAEAPVTPTGAVPNAVIREGEPSITSEVTYPSSLTIETVEVTVQIEHPQVSDLEIRLVHTAPDGNTSTSVFAHSRDVPASGPEENLRFRFTSVQHWGEDSSGRWRLEIQDRRTDGERGNGKLISWELKLHGTERPLTADELSQQARDLGVSFTGATILVPGWEPLDDEGDTLLPLAHAIRNRADGDDGTTNAWLFDYDQERGGFDGFDSLLPQPGPAGQAGELVVLFDWAHDSRQLSAGWTEAAGDALFAMLVDLELVDPAQSTGAPLHVIGVGMGAAVASEAIERLAQFDVPVDHLTYLDPHDFDQGKVYDQWHEQESLTRLGYGAAVWDNVTFADVYYQTRGRNGDAIADDLALAGRPIPGATNVLVNAYLPTAPYDELTIFGDHDWVWAGYYLATVLGSRTMPVGAPVPKDVPAPGRPIDTARVGYAHSRIADGTSDRPEPSFYTVRDRGSWVEGTFYEQFDIVRHGGQMWQAQVAHTARAASASTGQFRPEPYGNQPGQESVAVDRPYLVANYHWRPLANVPASQDHQFSDRQLVAADGRPAMAGLFGLGLSEAEVVTGRALPTWQVGSGPLNGQFELLGDQIATQAKRLPGWYYHGERPLSTEDPGPTVNFTGVTLDAGHPEISHNVFYVPQFADAVNVVLNVTAISGNDELVVKLGDVALRRNAPNPLVNLTGTADIISFIIPDDLKNQSHILMLSLVDPTGLEAAIRLTAVELDQRTATVAWGDILTLDLSVPLGGGPFQLEGPEDDAFEVLFRNGGHRGAFDGLLYLVPRIDSTHAWQKTERTHGTLRVLAPGHTVALTYRIDLVPGHSPLNLFGSVGAGGDNEFLDVLKVQQRLRFLNYRGERVGDGPAAVVPEVIVQGVLDPVTRQAIRLFQASVEADGNGNPAHMDGRVDPQKATERWLNSRAAPTWTPLRQALTNRVNIGQEIWDTSWTVQKIEHAFALRPELKRTTAFEEFGINSLTEYPDRGEPNFTAESVLHPGNSHKAGHGIDLELDQQLLATGSAQELENVRRDVLAFLQAEGIQIQSVYLGENNSQYAEIRTAIGDAIADPASSLPTLPTLSSAPGHNHHISIHVLPPQLDRSLTADGAAAIAEVFQALREYLAPAWLQLPEVTHRLPMVEYSIAELIDLERALALLPTFTDSTTLHELWQTLTHFVSRDGDLVVRLDQARVDVDRTTSANRIVIEFEFQAQQLVRLNSGGSLPQHSTAVPDVLDPSTAVEHISVDFRFPIRIALPGGTPALPGDVLVEIPEIALAAQAVSVRNYEGRIGLAPVHVVHDPVVLAGAFTTRPLNVIGTPLRSLTDLTDPFLAMEPANVTRKSIEGVLPLQAAACSQLTGADRVTITSDNIFVDTEPLVTRTAGVAELEVFAGLTSAEIVAGLQAAIQAIRSVTQSGLARTITPATPLIGPAASSILTALNDATNFVETIMDFDHVDLPFQTLNQLLGVTGLVLGVRRDAAASACQGNAYSLTIDYDRSFSHPITVQPQATGLGPLNITGGLNAQFTAGISVDLDIGFLFGATERSPVDYLALPLTTLNGGSGVHTVSGADLDVFAPQSSATRRIELAENRALAEALLTGLDDGGTVPTELVTLLAAQGLQLAPSAEVTITARRETWHLTDRVNRRSYRVQAVRAAGASFLAPPTALEIRGPGYLVDFTGQESTLADVFARIAADTTGRVNHQLQTDSDGLVTGFQLVANDAIPGQFEISSLAGVGAGGSVVRSLIGAELGIVQRDTDGDGKISGQAEVLSVEDRVFFGSNTGIQLQLDFQSPDADLGVALFGLGADVVDGQFHIQAQLDLGLQDSGTGAQDGRLTLRELSAGPFSEVVELLPAVRGFARLPVVLQPARLNPQFGIDPNHPRTPAEDGPEVCITFSAATEAANFDFQCTNQIPADTTGPSPGPLTATGAGAIPSLDNPSPPPERIDVVEGAVRLSVLLNEHFVSALDSLRNFVPDDICSGIDRVMTILELSEFGFLNERLPLVNQSLTELLEPGELLGSVIGALCRTPSAVRDRLQEALPALDNPHDPDRGAIPALLEELPEHQREELLRMRDDLTSAMHTDDAPTGPLPSPSPAPSDTLAAQDMIARVVAAIQRLRTFAVSLPPSVGRDQLLIALQQLTDAVPSVAALEELVEDALGLSDSARAQFDIEFNLSGAQKSIILDFQQVELARFAPASEPVPLDFTAATPDGEVNLSTSGNLTGNLSALLNMRLGIDLTDGLDLEHRVFFERDTELSIAGELVGTVTGELLAGGQQVAAIRGEDGGALLRFSAWQRQTLPAAPATPGVFTLPVGADPNLVLIYVNGAPASLDTYTIAGRNVRFSPSPATDQRVEALWMRPDQAKFTLSLTNGLPGDRSRITLAELFSAPAGGLASSRVTTSLQGGLMVSLPYEVSGLLDGQIMAFVDVAEPSPIVLADAGLTGWMDELLRGPRTTTCDLTGLSQGAIGFADLLQNVLTHQILAELPLIGDEINLTGTFVSDLRNRLVGLFAEDGLTADDVQRLLFDALGPDGANILVQADGRPLTDWAQIEVELPTTGSDCGHFSLRLGGREELGRLDFDLGLDAVDFELSGRAGIDLGFDFAVEIGLGFDLRQGAYLVLNGDPKDPEISLTLDARLTGDSQLGVELFGIAAQARENRGQGSNKHARQTTGITGTVSLDLQNGSQTRLNLGTLIQQPLARHVAVGGDFSAVVDLSLEIGVADSVELPRIATDFYFSWEVDANSTRGNNPFRVGRPEIELGNLRINVGETITQAIRPLLLQIDEYLKPIDPLIDFLSQEVPLLTQAAAAVGEPPVTMLDVIASYGEGLDSAVEFVDTVIKIRELAHTLAESSTSNLAVPLGSFAVALEPNERRRLGDLLNDDTLDSSGQGSLEEAAAELRSAEDEETSFLGEVLVFLREIGIKIPVLEDPTRAFGLLLGEPVDLITYDFLGANRLEAGFDWSVSFGPLLPPVPLFAEIFARFGIAADFQVGLDSWGLQTGTFSDGFYFSDVGPVLELTASFGAAAELNAGLAWGGVNGKVTGSITAGWNDINGDGRFRLPEIAARAAQGVECIFDIHGSLDALLTAYAGLGIKVFGVKVTVFEASVELLRETLFQFEAACPPLEPPNLGHVAEAVLYLHTGSRARLRQNGAQDSDESLIIELAEGASAGELIVKGFGQHQQFAGVRRIVADTGQGADSIRIGKGVTADVELDGGVGDDEIHVASLGNITVRGGAGQDRLVIALNAENGPPAPASVRRQLYGGPGNDVLTGGDLADELWGEEGDDQLNGGAGDDIVNGGQGNDVLQGGLGSDTLDGNAGDDTLVGGPITGSRLDGSNQLRGGPGNDVLQGGNANDRLWGGADNDLLHGNAGDDQLDGESGDDHIFGGDGRDQLTGGGGDDELHGGEGNDTYIFAAAVASEYDQLSDTGAGHDTLDLSQLVTDVQVNLTTGVIRHSGRRAQLREPHRFEHVLGGAGHDTLVDNQARNVLVGGNGDDTYLFGPRASGVTDYVVERNGSAGGKDTVSLAAVIHDVRIDLRDVGNTLGNSNIASHVGRLVSVLPPDNLGFSAGTRDSLEAAVGGFGHDTLIGNSQTNQLWGGPGRDTLVGGDGSDQLYGGSDRDELLGEQGNDELYGENGDDLLLGGSGDDQLWGGEGNDDLLGDIGADKAHGGTGHDYLFGGPQDDQLDGEAGFDVLWGGPGDDELSGGTGEDLLFGEAGADQLQGGPDRDFLLGMSGNDHLLGGPGDDFLAGGGDSGRRDPSLVEANLLTTSGLATFGDMLDGENGHDLILGGHPWETPQPGVPDAMAALVSQYFWDMFTTSSPRPIFLPQPGIDTSPSSFINNFLKVRFVDAELDQDDLLHGGLGNDLLLGGTGRDHLYGDWGNDALFAERLASSPPTIAGTPIDITTGDRLEGGPNDDGPLCGSSDANLLIGGTSEQNLAYIIHTRPRNETPTLGGYRVTSCADVPSAPLNFQPVELRGQKFRDVNANGLRDPFEPGLSGWIIQLRDADGTLLAETTTTDIDLNADGAIDPLKETGVYVFQDETVGGQVRNLVEGVYRITEVYREGYQQTVPNSNTQVLVPAGLADVISGGDVPTMGYEVLLRSGPQPGDGDIAEQLDFGSALLARLSGRVWEDRNGNQRLDDGETGRSGLTVRLVSHGENASFTVALATTDSQGYYRFNNVRPPENPLTLSVDLPAGVQASPATHLVTARLETSQSALDFGLIWGGSLAVSSWHDLNADGVRSDDEPNWSLPWLPRVVDRSGQTVNIDPATHTAGHLRPGVYTVTASVPVPLAQQSYPTAATLTKHMFLVESGTSIPAESAQFGFFLPGSIQGRLVHDANADGELRESDGWSGIAVYLDREVDGELQLAVETMVTKSPGGSYEFSDLRPGRYRVRIALPTDLAWTEALSDEIMLLRSDEKLEINVGAAQSFELFGITFHDRNLNGRRDLGEEGLPNWLVFLDESGDGLATRDPFGFPSEPSARTRFDAFDTSADESGSYSLGRFAAGQYRLVLEGKTGWRTTTAASPLVSLSTSGQLVSFGVWGIPSCTGADPAAQLQRDLAVANYLLGDLNFDNRVDALDYERLNRHFGELGSYAEGDLTCDGSIGLEDLVALGKNYGRISSRNLLLDSAEPNRDSNSTEVEWPRVGSPQTNWADRNSPTAGLIIPGAKRADDIELTSSDQPAPSPALLEANSPFSYAWVSNSTSDSYTINSPYSFNESGRPIDVTRLVAGSYRVTFRGLGAVQPDAGHAQVTPYGTSNFCTVNTVERSGDDVAVTVNCFSPAGTAANTRFNLAVISRDNIARISYVTASRPTQSNYRVAASLTSRTEPVDVERVGTGSYLVRWRNLPIQTPNGQHAQISALDEDAARCTVTFVTTTGVDATTAVTCVSPAGNPRDTAFNLALFTVPNSPNVDWVLANQSQAASYTPSVKSDPNAQVTVTRSGVGRYAVRFPDINRSAEVGGHVQVSAAGFNIENYCNVSSWTNSGDDITANVSCYAPGGNAADTVFHALFVPTVVLTDPLEPNGSFTLAHDLGSGYRNETNLQVTCGEICTDKDFFTWTASVDGQMQVDVTAATANRTTLHVYNGSQQLLRQVLPSSTTNQRVTLAVSAGTRYFVRVTSDLLVNYALSVRMLDRFEPNNTLSQATPLSANDAVYSGLTIHAPGDPDWFRWTAPLTGPLRIAALFGHADGDLELRLHNAAGAVLAAVNSTDDDEQLFANVVAGNVYYIQVTGVNGATHSNYSLTLDSPELATISGVAFEDLNANGVRDRTPVLEPLRAGITVYLDQNGNGRLDTGEPTAVTSQSGEYRFSSVPAGPVQVRQLVNAGWQATGPEISYDPRELQLSTNSQTSTQMLVAGDYSGDGLTDLAVLLRGAENSLVIVEGSSSRQPRVVTLVASITGLPLHIAPLVGNNGRQELAVVGDGQLQIWARSGTNYSVTATQPLAITPSALVTADFNGDGRHDLVVADASGRVTTLLRQSSGAFLVANATPSLNAPITGVASGDFNNDGLMDLVVATRGAANDDAVRLLLNRADRPGEFVPTNQLGTTTSGILSTTDWNQDGRLDLVTSRQILLATNNTAQFGFQQEPTLFGAQLQLVTNDWNGDGYPDISGIQPLASQNSLQVMTNNRSGGLRSLVSVPVSPSVLLNNSMVPRSLSVIGSGDFDGDGRVDLAAGYSPTAGVTLLYGSRPLLYDLTAATNQQFFSRDFGAARLGRITGSTFLSSDCSGPYDSGSDSWLSGTTVFVDMDDDGELDTGEPSSITGNNGNYVVSNIPLGTWSVRAVPPAGLLMGFPDVKRHVVELTTSGATATQRDFGFFSRFALADGADQMYGGRGNDVLYGDNRLVNPCVLSLGGDDVLSGEEGNDVLIGQQRNDTYRFQSTSGQDTIFEAQGGGTADAADAGLADKLDFQLVAAVHPVTATLTDGDPLLSADLIAVFGPNSVSTGSGSRSSIEGLLGGLGADVLIGNQFNNELDGRDGGDVIQGGAGDDTYGFAHPITAGDRLLETLGDDTLNFAAIVDRSVDVNLRLGQYSLTGSGVSLLETPELFENVRGTNHGAGGDRLVGNSNDNVLTGLAGADQLDGQQGSDTLDGGSGDDRYVFQNGWGHDTILESAHGGYDRLDFSATTTNLLVTIGAAVLVSDDSSTAAHSGTHLEEIVTGTGTFTIVGGADVNRWVIDGPNSGMLNGVRFRNASRLQGGAGRDEFIFTSAGIIAGDLRTGAGDDWVDLSQGGQVLGAVDGELGLDTLRVPGNQPAMFNLTAHSQGRFTQNAQATPFRGMEVLEGSDLDDVLILAEHTLNGTFLGGLGTDTVFTHPTAATQVSLTDTGAGTIHNRTATSTFAIFRDVENISGGSGDDVYRAAGGGLIGRLDGGGGLNALWAELPYEFSVTGERQGHARSLAEFVNIGSLVGSVYSDRFELHFANSKVTIDGGSGLDTLVSSHSASSFVIDGSNAGTVSGVRFANIENLIGSLFEDQFELARTGQLSGTVDGSAGLDQLFVPATAGKIVPTAKSAGYVTTGTEILIQYRQVEAVQRRPTPAPISTRSGWSFAGIWPTLHEAETTRRRPRLAGPWLRVVDEVFRQWP